MDESDFIAFSLLIFKTNYSRGYNATC